MSEGAPEFKIVFKCKCGWVRPKRHSCLKCPKCGGLLKPVAVKHTRPYAYSNAYRNAHWRPCTRYGCDPRTCGSLHFGKICGRDKHPCNAEWTGDKDT